SSRSGTRAFTMEREGGIPFREKKRREKILLDIARTSRQDYQHQFIGQTLNVLIESTASARKSSGYSENYIPVLVNNTRDYHLDTVVPVRIESEAGDVLVGTVADIQS
ncbi:MAG: TRAM domain-containing protein, partial [Candidatus Atribacteria bacterium]|nr:TRAM domain-containing protein [Candidatus Atribacteria bacterium]